MIEGAVGNSVSLLRNIQSNVISILAAFDIINNDVTSYNYIFVFVFIDFLRLLRRRGPTAALLSALQTMRYR